MQLKKLLDIVRTRKIYIYGAGLYARQLIAILEANDLTTQICGIVVTKKQEQTLCGPFSVTEYNKDLFDKNQFFFLAMREGEAVANQLKTDGFTKIYYMTPDMIPEIKKMMFQIIKSKYPVYKNTVLFDCYSGKGYGCNPKYIAEYLRMHYKYIRLVWLVRETVQAELPEDICPVQYGTYDYYYQLYTAGFIVGNVGVAIEPYKRKEQYVIQTWHGAGCYKKAGLDQNASHKPEEIKFVRSFALIDLCVSSTKGNTQMYRQSFQYQGEIGEYGSPRADILFHNTGVREKVCNQFRIDSSKKIVLYAPTYRDQIGLSFDQYDLNMRRVILSLQDRFGSEFVLMYRFHQTLYLYDRGKNYYPYGINVTMYHDVMEFLVAADVLITDYSSIMWDFGLQRRPIFLYQNDEEQYTNDRGFYKPISTWPYPIAHTEQELLDNIKYFDEQDYLKKLEAFIAADPSYDDGHASERVVKRIMDVIEHPSKYGKE